MARVRFPPKSASVWGGIVVCISFTCATLIIHRQGGSIASHESAASHQGDRAQSTRLRDGLQGLPLSFESNRGQADGQVRFLSRGSRYTLFLTGNEAVLALRKGSRQSKVEGRTGVAIGSADLAFRSAAFPGLSRSPAAESKPNSRTADPRTGSALRELALLPTAEQLRESFAAHEGTAVPNPESRTPAVVRMKLVGANERARVTGLEELPGKSNYFIGNDPKKWRTKVPNYAKVKYANVYPGVDLVYYGNQRQLEYDFVVQPGVDPRSIQLAINSDEQIGSRQKAVGSEIEPQSQSAIDNRKSSIRAPLRIDGNGDLVVRIDDDGDVRLHKPVVYQVNRQGVRVYLDGRYIFAPAKSKIENPKSKIHFAIAAYDRSRPLVIDPVLAYSTYFGGSVDEGIFGITWDPEGNFYVAGETSSPDFPILNGFQPTLGGSYDGFVSKFDPTGTKLLYSTYLGGSQFDHCVGVTVDAGGSARVAGFTESSDFPTFSAFQSTIHGPTNAFASRLDPSGSKLVFSTYLGGSSTDVATGIALDVSGNTYLAGYTYSLDFPVTSNAFQKVCDQGYISGFCFGDAFVTKLNPRGSKLLYSTYLGGEATDSGQDITVDRWGAAYVTGLTASSNFPTVNAAQKTFGGGQFDAFVTKIDPTGTGIVYSTYLGGSNFDEGLGIAVDVQGNAYVAGQTESTDFPVKNAIQPACKIGAPPTNFCYDAFVAKLSGAGNQLYYSTFWGGSGFDLALRISVDALGSASIVGLTTSMDFPTSNAIQPTFGGGFYDAFVAKFNAPGSAPLYSTYLGGTGDEFGYGTNVDGAGNVWVTGSTSSLNFPLVHPYQGTYAGGPFDAYISKIALAVPQSIGVLEGEVRNLVVEGILNHGRAQSLLVKLRKAQENVIEGDREDASEELRAFTERVEDYISKGVLPLEQGGRLRSAALDIISRLCEK